MHRDVTIRIRHSNDIISVYAHLARFCVKQGQSVKKGQVIGTIGPMPNSFINHFNVWFYHMHFSCDYNHNSNFDPL